MLPYYQAFDCVPLYLRADWRQLYQTMCTSCNFPIEPGDKWVEAMNNNYHSECFNCSVRYQNTYP